MNSWTNTYSARRARLLTQSVFALSFLATIPCLGAALFSPQLWPGIRLLSALIAAVLIRLQVLCARILPELPALATAAHNRRAHSQGWLLASIVSLASMSAAATALATTNTEINSDCQNRTILRPQLRQIAPPAPLLAPDTPNPSMTPRGLPPATAALPSQPSPKPSPPNPSLHPHPKSASPSRPEIHVAPGDSLWSIISTHLGPNNNAKAISAAIPAWMAANPHLNNADELTAGTRLSPPLEKP